jgi:NAD(P)-dependent dehydrogenase (short-subunit alcohol dehydrogenase family)
VHDFRAVVAFVTGGGNGIGRAIVSELARAGAHVAVTDLDGDAAAAAADEVREAGGTAFAVGLDVRDRAAYAMAADAAEQALGPVRLLVNNAGVGLIEPVASTTSDDWRWVMDVNYFGVVNGLEVFLPRLLALGGERHITVTASMSGLFATPLLAGYNASKFALVGLTEATRAELAPVGIGVTMLCPSLVGTRIMGRSRRLRNEQSRPPALLGHAPERGEWEAGRIATPEECAALLLAGIRGNELYVMTHPEERAMVAERFAAVLAAFDRGGSAS